MVKIEMYKKDACPYCDKAIQLLASKNLAENIEYFNIEKDHEQLKNMLQRSQGRKTVPQIFINEKHIGGYDDLKLLIDNNQLEEFIKV